jgi:hypothetical protein
MPVLIRRPDQAGGCNSTLNDRIPRITRERHTADRE